MSATSSPQVGADFGDYRIDALLGRGAMGVVFRAWQRRMDRPVALKVLPAELAEDAVYRSRFAREAAALARLDSPHVIQIYDHGEQDGSLYLAMQLVQGIDLGRVVEDGVMSPRRALRIVAQVAAALGDGHAVGVVHRDVKPSNVMLRDRAPHDDPDAEDADFVYLCDFGIARGAGEAGPGTETAGVIGTLAYLAPERLHGRPATPASDVYSLGGLLWALLTGAPPYVGTQPEVIVGHVQGAVPRLAGDDRRTELLNDLLAGMLAKDPARRPSIADVRRQVRDLLAVAGTRRVSAAPRERGTSVAPGADTVTTPGPGRPPRDTLPERPLRRRWVLAGVAAAVVVGVAVVAVVLLDPARSAADRLSRATPLGATCVAAAVPEDAAGAGALAQVVCDVGDELGELRVVALRGGADDYLSRIAGQDPSALQNTSCPVDIPAAASWERGELVCFVRGSNTRYAWTFEDLDAVAVLDGRADRSFPQDVEAVDGYFTGARYP